MSKPFPYLEYSQSVLLDSFLSPDNFRGILFVHERMAYRCHFLDTGSFRIHKAIGKESSTLHTIVVGELVRHHENGSLRTPRRP